MADGSELTGIVMERYGPDHWVAIMTFKTIEEASRHFPQNGVSAWRIVVVSGLPVDVAPGNVL